MIKISLIVIILGLYGMISSHKPEDDLQESIKRGEQVYATNCMSCHMMNGAGLPGVYPPLVEVDSLLTDVPANINIILQGQKGETSVNGMTYNTDMPSQNYLTDEQIADVLNYVRNSWGNKGDLITPDEVRTERDKL